MRFTYSSALYWGGDSEVVEFPCCQLPKHTHCLVSRSPHIPALVLSSLPLLRLVSLKVSSHRSLPYLESFFIPLGSFLPPRPIQRFVDLPSQPIPCLLCPFIDWPPSPAAEVHVKLSSSLLPSSFLRLLFTFYSILRTSLPTKREPASCLPFPKHR